VVSFNNLVIPAEINGAIIFPLVKSDNKQMKSLQSLELAKYFH